MKKRISFLLMLCVMIFLVACSSNTTLPDSNNQQQANSDNKTSDENFGSFDKNATIEETAMVDENDVKITATGLNYTNNFVDLEVMIENNSDKNLSFVSGSVGYSCNSVNGYMVSSGYLNCDVAAGKKANGSIHFGYDELMLYGIHEIADIEIGFSIIDDDYNHIYTGPRQVKTSAFDTYDYGKNRYQSTITAQAAMKTYNYDMKHFSHDVSYDENGVKLLSSGVMVNRDGDRILLLEIENNTSDMVYIATSNIALNGLIVNSSIWSSDAINPEKHGIIDVNISSILDSSYWSVYGIEEIGAVSLSLSQRNSDGEVITKEATIEIIIPGVKAEFDSSGNEIYNNGGLRIVAKSIVEDSSKYNADMHVLLLAENNSGKTLVIDDVYDSLSVNGFMTDYSFYSKEIKNGESAMLEIKLRESSLADNKISSVSDVKEVEMNLKIRDGYNTIDNPTIQILYE